MSWNFLDAVKGHFTNDLIGQAASYLGESNSVVSKGLEAVIPVTLAGIVRKAETGDTNTLSTLAKTAFDSGILNNLAGTFSASGGGVPKEGPGLISSLFGDKFGGVANAITSFTGMKGASTSSLMGTVVPLALGLLGRYIKDNNTTPGALASLLGGQKSAIWSALPSGFNLGKIFDTEPVRAAAHVVHEEKKKSNWLWPLLLALGGLALLWWLMKGCNGDKVADTPTVVTDTIVKTDTVTKTNIVVINREPLKVKLPNGVELDAYKGGIEDLLVAFLNDPNAKPGNDNWFDFNDLNFETATANILPDSRKQLDNIMQILKAYPNVKIKLGGYTDKVGDDAANKKLSQERANAVMTALKDAGVGAQVQGAEGYGEEFAKFPESAPDEDRVKDRRVSVSVRAK